MAGRGRVERGAGVVSGFEVTPQQRAAWELQTAIERVARDTRLGPIGGGTDEIMKEILGKQLGL